MDPEIDAMDKVATALGDLDQEAKSRVLKWAAERFGVAIRPATTGRREQGGNSGDGGGGELDNATPKAFGQFVDLFDAVTPKSDVEKAVTAAYWFQQVQNMQSWPSQQINTALKDVGHGVSN